jgi:hypothetical protein
LVAISAVEVFKQICLHGDVGSWHIAAQGRRGGMSANGESWRYDETCLASRASGRCERHCFTWRSRMSSREETGSALLALPTT